MVGRPLRGVWEVGRRRYVPVCVTYTHIYIHPTSTTPQLLHPVPLTNPTIPCKGLTYRQAGRQIDTQAGKADRHPRQAGRQGRQA
jgi:hypothetical protein